MPFSDEFALLYEESLSGQPEEDRQRQWMADYHKAKGYLKFAQATSDRRKGALALTRALKYRPDLLFRQGYYARWLRLLEQG